MDRRPPEEQLLTVFQEELIELKADENSSYADYMAHQSENFQSRQKQINALIDEINHKFDGMTESEKQTYQSRWTATFQPVVQEIYTRTHEMVVRETRDLTPQEMARIKELSMLHKSLEKETPQSQLKPRFFIMP